MGDRRSNTQPCRSFRARNLRPVNHFPCRSQREKTKKRIFRNGFVRQERSEFVSRRDTKHIEPTAPTVDRDASDRHTVSACLADTLCLCDVAEIRRSAPRLQPTALRRASVGCRLIPLPLCRGREQRHFRDGCEPFPQSLPRSAAAACVRRKSDRNVPWHQAPYRSHRPSTVRKLRP